MRPLAEARRVDLAPAGPCTTSPPRRSGEAARFELAGLAETHEITGRDRFEALRRNARVLPACAAPRSPSCDTTLSLRQQFDLVFRRRQRRRETCRASGRSRTGSGRPARLDEAERQRRPERGAARRCRARAPSPRAASSLRGRRVRRSCRAEPRRRARSPRQRRRRPTKTGCSLVSPPPNTGSTGTMRASSAKRLKNSSSGPKTTDGRSTIASGNASRTASSARPLLAI